MLIPAANTAKCFLRDAEVGGNITERYTREDMRCFAQQVIVPFCSGFELGIHKTFFEADIIFFITDPYRCFGFGKAFEQLIKLFFSDDDKRRRFQELYIFYGGFPGYKTVKGSGKIIFKGKPVRDLFPVQVVKSPKASFFNKIKMTAYLSFPQQVSVFSKNDFFETLLYCFSSRCTERMNIF